MQLLARDSQGRVLFVEEAFRGRNYFCSECGSCVRLREGTRRQRHFYHLQRSRDCRQSGKSLEHLAVQRQLFQQLPKGEGFLEHRFPEIGRVADLFWKPRSLVFEVQCSPISAEEVRARNADYGALGLEVVWILHLKRFGRGRVSAAEFHLSRRPCYYTDIDTGGRGVFTDRVRGAPPLRVFLHRPKPFWSSKLPQSLRHRSICFEGDAVDVFTDQIDPDYCRALQEIAPYSRRGFRLSHLYKTLLHHLLDILTG